MWAWVQQWWPLLTGIWLALVGWVWCLLIVAARADDATHRAVQSPRQLLRHADPLSMQERRALRTAHPRDFGPTAAWLNSAGELRMGPLAIAKVKSALVCHYQLRGVHLFGRSLYECADVAARLEAMRERETAHVSGPGAA